jgi:tetratricopeptide (TPR) repeat protein
MPSHIFVQLGMWREAANSNDQGWAASVDYVKRKQLPPALRDYHNLHWLIYAALQEGRYAKAGTFVEEFVRMRANNELASYSARYINSALAAYIIETRSWSRAESLFGARPDPAVSNSPAGRGVELCGAPPVLAAKAAPAKKGAVARSSTTTDTPAFLRAFSVAMAGRPLPGAAGAGDASNSPRFAKVHELQLTGLVRANAGDFPAAIAALREAAEMEGRTSRPPGPPVEKPAHELLGEMLLRARDPQGATAQFKIALERHPNRALSLLGCARAEAAAGEKTAARDTYAKLLAIWQNADPDLPELHEARNYVNASKAVALR